MTDHMKTAMRTDLVGALRAEDVGRTVSVCGWVGRRREHGEHLAFLDLRDHSGVLQCVIDGSVDVRSEYVVRVTGTPARLPMETSAALYRIVQEGLGNIFRHARASKVDLAMQFEDHTVRLAIADDGIGLGETEPGARVGFGMGNLRQRVEDLHGTLLVSSQPGEGTRIEVCVPVTEGA